jgi:hypothetical protein
VTRVPSELLAAAARDGLTRTQAEKRLRELMDTIEVTTDLEHDVELDHRGGDVRERGVARYRLGLGHRRSPLVFR